MDWTKVLYLAGAALLAWFGFRLIKNNPAAFSKQNLNKSFTTFGLLTLMMMAVIAVCVMLLRS